MLLLQILFAIGMEIGYPFFREWQIENRKLGAKIAFNELLRAKIVPDSVLHCLKILINNYESLSDLRILNSRDLFELQDACNNLVPQQKTIFLLYSKTMNLALLGSIVFPGVTYSLRKVIRGSIRTTN